MINVPPGCFCNTHVCKLSRQQDLDFRFPSTFFPNYSSTFNSVSFVVSLLAVLFPTRIHSPPLPHTQTHFPSPSLLSLISTSQSPRRVFFPIENKLLREHTCQHTRLRTATNGCCHYFTNCLLCASPPSHLQSQRSLLLRGYASIKHTHSCIGAHKNTNSLSVDGLANPILSPPCFFLLQLRTYTPAASCLNNVISVFSWDNPRGSHLSARMLEESLQHVSHFHVSSAEGSNGQSFMKAHVAGGDGRASRRVRGNTLGNFHRGTCVLVPLHEMMQQRFFFPHGPSEMQPHQMNFFFCFTSPSLPIQSQLQLVTFPCVVTRACEQS